MAYESLTARLQVEGPFGIEKVVKKLNSELAKVKLDLDSKITKDITANLNLLSGAIRDLNSAARNTGSVFGGLSKSVNSYSSSTKTATTATQSQGNAAQNAARNNKVLAQSINEASSELHEFGRLSGLAFRRFTAFALPTSAAFGLFTAIKGGFKDAIDFERQMIRVAQSADNTVKNMKGVSDQIRRLAENFGASSGELVEVARLFAQAGFNANQMQDALDAVAKTSLSPSFDNMAETAKGAIAIMNQFKIRASELEEVFGGINRLAAQSAVDAKDIVTATQTAGGVFAVMSEGIRGVGDDLLSNKEKFFQFASLFTSIRDTTQESAESISTALRSIFTRLIRPESIKLIEDLKLEVRDLKDETGRTTKPLKLTDEKGLFVGNFEAIQRMGEAFQDVNSRTIELAKILEDLGGVRLQGKLIPALKQYAQQQSLLKTANEAGLSLDKDRESAMTSLGRQLDQTAEKFRTLISNIEQSNTFKDITKIALGFADALIEVADAFRPLLPIFAGSVFVKGISSFKQFVDIGKGFSEGIKSSGGAREFTRKAFTRRAMGGPVYANGGATSSHNQEANSLLMPGEFVIDPEQVKRIGVHRLQKFNADGNPRHLDGHKISPMIVPGQGYSDSVPANLPNGAFVVRKKYSERSMRNANSGLKKFARGGIDHYSSMSYEEKKERASFISKYNEASPRDRVSETFYNRPYDLSGVIPDNLASETVRRGLYYPYGEKFWSGKSGLRDLPDFFKNYNPFEEDPYQSKSRLYLSRESDFYTEIPENMLDPEHLHNLIQNKLHGTSSRDYVNRKLLKDKLISKAEELGQPAQSYIKEDYYRTKYGQTSLPLEMGEVLDDIVGLRGNTFLLNHNPRPSVREKLSELGIDWTTDRKKYMSIKKQTHPAIAKIRKQLKLSKAFGDGDNLDALNKFARISVKNPLELHGRNIEDIDIDVMGDIIRKAYSNPENYTTEAWLRKNRPPFNSFNRESHVEDRVKWFKTNIEAATTSHGIKALDLGKAIYQSTLSGFVDFQSDPDMKHVISPGKLFEAFGYDAVEDIVDNHQGKKFRILMPTDGNNIFAGTGKMKQIKFANGGSFSTNKIKPGKPFEIPTGTKGIRNIMQELTTKTGKEVALFRDLKTKKRYGILGDEDSVRIPQKYKENYRLIAHTHPPGYSTRPSQFKDTGPFGNDVSTLLYNYVQSGQRSSLIIPGSKNTNDVPRRFSVPPKLKKTGQYAKYTNDTNNFLELESFFRDKDYPFYTGYKKSGLTKFANGGEKRKQLLTNQLNHIDYVLRYSKPSAQRISILQKERLSVLSEIDSIEKELKQEQQQQQQKTQVPNRFILGKQRLLPGFEPEPYRGTIQKDIGQIPLANTALPPVLSPKFVPGRSAHLPKAEKLGILQEAKNVVRLRNQQEPTGILNTELTTEAERQQKLLAYASTLSPKRTASLEARILKRTGQIVNLERSVSDNALDPFEYLTSRELPRSSSKVFNPPIVSGVDPFAQQQTTNQKRASDARRLIALNRAGSGSNRYYKSKQFKESLVSRTAGIPVGYGQSVSPEDIPYFSPGQVERLNISPTAGIDRARARAQIDIQRLRFKERQSIANATAEFGIGGGVAELERQANTFQNQTTKTGKVIRPTATSGVVNTEQLTRATTFLSGISNDPKLLKRAINKYIQALQNGATEQTAATLAVSRLRRLTEGNVRGFGQRGGSGFIGGISSGLGKTDRFVREHGTSLALAAYVGAPAISAAIQRTDPKSAEASRIGGGISGALLGGISGAQAGSFFGPVGTAIGAVGGAAIGGITSASSSYAQKRLDLATENLSSNTKLASKSMEVFFDTKKASEFQSNLSALNIATKALQKSFDEVADARIEEENTAGSKISNYFGAVLENIVNPVGAIFDGISNPLVDIEQSRKRSFVSDQSRDDLIRAQTEFENAKNRLFKETRSELPGIANVTAEQYVAQSIERGTAEQELLPLLTRFGGQGSDQAREALRRRAGLRAEGKKEEADQVLNELSGLFVKVIKSHHEYADNLNQIQLAIHSTTVANDTYITHLQKLSETLSKISNSAQIADESFGNFATLLDTGFSPNRVQIQNPFNFPLTLERLETESQLESIRNRYLGGSKESDLQDTNFSFIARGARESSKVAEIAPKLLSESILEYNQKRSSNNNVDKINANLVSIITEKFSKEFSGTPFLNILSKELSSINKESDKDFSAENLERIRNLVNEMVKSSSSGLENVKKLVDQDIEIITRFAARANVAVKSMSDIGDKLDEITIASQELENQKIRFATEKDVSPEKIIEDQLNLIRGRTGRGGFAPITDPDAIARRIRLFENDIGQDTEELKRRPDLARQKVLSDQILKNTDQLNNHRKALEMLAKSNGVLAAVQNKLVKFEEQKQAGQDILERLSLAATNPEEYIKLLRDIRDGLDFTQGKVTERGLSNGIPLLEQLAKFEGKSKEFGEAKTNILLGAVQNRIGGNNPDGANFLKVLSERLKPIDQQQEAQEIINKFEAAASLQVRALSVQRDLLYRNTVALNALNNSILEADFKTLGETLSKTTSILGAKDQGQAKRGGGVISGQYKGNRDTEVTRLVPGEFVVRRNVTQKHIGLLSHLNSTGELPAFAKGGFTNEQMAVIERQRKKNEKRLIDRGINEKVDRAKSLLSTPKSAMEIGKGFSDRQVAVIEEQRRKNLSKNIDRFMVEIEGKEDPRKDDLAKALNARKEKQIAMIQEKRIFAAEKLKSYRRSKITPSGLLRAMRASNRATRNLRLRQEKNRKRFGDPDTILIGQDPIQQNAINNNGIKINEFDPFPVNQFDLKMSPVIFPEIPNEDPFNSNVFELPRFNSGGPTDSIMAAVTPGEFVVRKNVASKHAGFLEQLNKTGKLPGFATGGMIGGYDGVNKSRAEEKGGWGIPQDLTSALTTFSNASKDLSNALGKLTDLSKIANQIAVAADKFSKVNIPSTLKFESAPIQVNVVVNGQEAFSTMQDSIRDLVIGKINETLSKHINVMTGETNESFFYG